MTNLFGRGIALAASVLAFGSSAIPAARGSEVPTSDPPPPVSASPSPSPSPGTASTSPSRTSPSPSTSTSYHQAPSDFALTVSPTRLVVGRADFGKGSQFLVVNQGRSMTPVTVQERNFVGRPDGSFAFQKNAPYAASNWLRVGPLNFTVPPGATQVVTVAYRIPANAEPGDHQVALAFIVPSRHGSGNVRINRGIAAPIYITVPGRTTDSVSLGNLSAPGFAMKGPVTITATVRDTGSVHRDFRGDTVLAIHAAGSVAVFPDFTVLRGSTRDISTTWNPPLLCICHPTVSVVNANGSVQSAGIRVIVFPVHLLGILLGALAALVVGLRIRRRRRNAGSAGGAAPQTASPGGPGSNDDV